MNAREENRYGELKFDQIASRLLAWYARFGRKFSFRYLRDPYSILIAEILLRKTTARQVDKVFPEFIRRYPSFKALAEASVGDVEKLIRPLGLRGRAIQLLQIAKQVVDRFNGELPKNEEELKKLPGVGGYIAGCVLTFAYHIRKPLVDSNVKRVLSRLAGYSNVPMKSKELLRRLSEIYLLIAPKGAERDFHYALLDLAALICRPKEPRCEECPVAKLCIGKCLKNDYF